MMLSFELRMLGAPCNWTGDRKNYVKVCSVGSKSTIKPGYYEYGFGDGWRGSVAVREVDVKTANKLRRESDGFCGYDWMVDEIRAYGRIRTLAERTDEEAKKQGIEL